MYVRLFPVLKSMSFMSATANRYCYKQPPDDIHVQSADEQPEAMTLMPIRSSKEEHTRYLHGNDIDKASCRPFKMMNRLQN